MTLELRARSTTGLPLALAGAAVCAQITYPLLHGAARDRITIVIVLLYAAVAFSHAAETRGRRAVLALAGAAVVLGFAIEVVGVHTGFPFGRYAYGPSLGPRLLGVPVVIAFAWPMLAWPAALVARRLASSPGVRVLIGAWALASWDLFLDPQMVAAGHWRWLDNATALPGVPSVPISDYAGWCCVALLMSAVLQRALDDVPSAADDRVAYGLYLWTWLSSVLALAVFLDLPAAALWGGLGMGTVAVPLARSLHR
jgi:uncharacterized membrane protein